MSEILNAHPGDYIQLQQGVFQFEANEVHLRTSYDDPPGVSLHNDYGNSLGKLSGKHNGEEQVLLQMKRVPGKGGEFYLGVLDQAKYQALQAQGDPQALDHAMIEAINVKPDGIEFRLPVRHSAGVVNGPSGTTPQQFTSHDQRYLCVEQGDGNLVVYDQQRNGIAAWDRVSYEAWLTG